MLWKKDFRIVWYDIDPWLSYFILIIYKAHKFTNKNAINGTVLTNKLHTL